MKIKHILEIDTEPQNKKKRASLLKMVSVLISIISVLVGLASFFGRYS